MLPFSAGAAEFIEHDNLPSMNNGEAPYPLSVLESGTNTVYGSLQGSCVYIFDCNPPSLPEDANTQDNFFFNIPVGYRLVELSVIFEQMAGPPELTAGFAITDNLSTLFGDSFLHDGQVFSAPFILGAGNYFAVFYGTGADDVGDYAVNYSYNLVLEPVAAGAVPEPATWAMMITGFGMAGAALRRRNRAFVPA
jgi:hypothetical protein